MKTNKKVILMEDVIQHIQGAGIYAMYAKNMLSDLPITKDHIDLVCRSLACIQTGLEEYLATLKKECHAK